MQVRLRALAGLLVAALVLATVVPCEEPPGRAAAPSERSAEHAHRATHAADVAASPDVPRADEASLVARCHCGCDQRPTVAGAGGGLAPAVPSAKATWAAPGTGAALPTRADAVAAAPALEIDHVPRVS